MRVPISWLKDFVDIDDISVEEIAYRLTLAGFEVDGIEYIGVPIGDVDPAKSVLAANDPLVWDREKLVVGHILEVKPHPNADRLVLAMVESGMGAVETCVTGAPNLFEYKGQGPLETPLITGYAREGAVVFDGHKDDGSLLTLKPRELRGIENKTMVLSQKELGLSESHDGILLFETDAAPGTPLQDVLGDAVLILDLTPNLSRAFSIIGVAREIAAIFNIPIAYPQPTINATGPVISGQVDIEIREPELNPRFTLALLKGIQLGPSPWHVRHRLELVGMRPINNMVDVTNYVMMETGQPLHAFDYDILVERAGGSAPMIITRTPEKGEQLTTLDDIERELDPQTILVADTAGALSLGGIMGGKESEINDSTTNVLLESANWNLINLRQTLTGQRERGNAIRSEAATRFSRGVHPEQALVGLMRGIEMMHELSGGEIAKGIIDNYPVPRPDVVVELPLKEIRRVIGMSIKADDVINILERLEFDVAVENRVLKATVPNYRLDIGLLPGHEHEDIATSVGQADLLEEIARIYGYDRIPNTMLVDELPPQRNNPGLQWEEFVRDVLAKLGLQEMITYRFTTPEAEAQLIPPGAESSLPKAAYVELANPISADKTVMRHTLLASALQILANNSRWRTREALFEVGKVFHLQPDSKLPEEPRHLCIAMMGTRDVTTWQSSGSIEEDLMDFFDIKGVVEGLLEALHVESAQFERSNHSSYFPGRVAALRIGDVLVGELGQIHPLVAEAFSLPDQPVLAAEFNLDSILGQIDSTYEVEPLSTYPAVNQDIAVIVSEDTAAAEVEQLIWEAGGDLLRYVQLFDVYRDDRLGEGRKSLAYSLVFQADDRTLKDKQANKIRGKIEKALQHKLSAEIRKSS